MEGRSDAPGGPTLVVATGNLGKLKEIREILGPDVALLTLQDFPGLPEIVEDGDTFKANAIRKARTVATLTGRPALGDDSGLEVDALDGAPGVYSARFAGEAATDAENNALLLARLQDVSETERTARFRCVVAVAAPEQHLRVRTRPGRQRFPFQGLLPPRNRARRCQSRDPRVGAP